MSGPVDPRLQQAIAHQLAGRVDQARALYESLLAGLPDHAEANHNLGLILFQGAPAEGAARLKRALEAQPSEGRYWLSYITALVGCGRPEEAAAVLAQGRAMGLAGDPVQALDDQIRAALPTEAEVAAFGSLLQAGRSEAAIAAARALTERLPGHGYGWKALGAALEASGRLEEAVAALQRALELKPEDPEIHNNLGNALKRLGLWPAAEQGYRRALALRPDYPEAQFNLAVVLSDLNRRVEAQQLCREAVARLPGLAAGHQLLASLSAYLSDHSVVVAESDLALSMAPGSEFFWETRLYLFSYHPELTAEAIFSEFVRWGDRIPDPVTDFSNHDRSPGRRLKVGYVSPDFRGHTSRFYFAPLMEGHDRDAFEVFAYSNVKEADAHTDHFRGAVDQWRDIRPLSDEAAAALIREDGIDILVDCCNHMRDHRLGVFALKPAPIQVTWLGAAWTTGLKAIDYVLFDPHIAPEGTLAREEIVRLPHCFVAYRPPEAAAELAQPPALKTGHVTFGYSGRTERLNHKTFRVWGEILNRVPRSRLVLDYTPFEDPSTQAYYRGLMARHGLDPERMTMRRSANIFVGLNDIDILLDCFPHSGGTMLFDALWMGVPALTLKSRPPLGRIGTTLMMNLGMADWVAETEADYIDKAVGFAGDLDGLTKIRTGLRMRMRASPLMDEVGFAREVEDAYRKMWSDWLEP